MTEDLFTPANGYTANVTAENLADLFNVSRPMVYKYVEAGMPQRARNTYDLQACVRWMLERANRPTTGTEETTRSQLNTAQREKVELETGRMRGELIPRDDVRRVFQDLAAVVSTQLDALGARVAPFATTWATPAAAQAAILIETNAIRASVAAALVEYVSAPPAAAPVKRQARKAKQAA